MKTIKAVTDFGIIEVKTSGGKKTILNHEWIIADVPHQYMNAKEPLIMRRILHYKTGCKLPVTIHHRETNKTLLAKAEDFLKNIPCEEISKEIGKYDVLN